MSAINMLSAGSTYFKSAPPMAQAEARSNSLRREILISKMRNTPFGISVVRVKHRLFITNVREGTVAWNAGLAKYDCIESVDWQTIPLHEDLRTFLRRLKQAASFVLSITDNPLTETYTLTRAKVFSSPSTTTLSGSGSSTHLSAQTLLLGIVYMNGEVSDIMPMSAAKNAKVPVGHTIVAVDGVEMLGMCDVSVMTAVNRAYTAHGTVEITCMPSESAVELVNALHQSQKACMAATSGRAHSGSVTSAGSDSNLHSPMYTPPHSNTNTPVHTPPQQRRNHSNATNAGVVAARIGAAVHSNATATQAGGRGSSGNTTPTNTSICSSANNIRSNRSSAVNSAATTTTTIAEEDAAAMLSGDSEIASDPAHLVSQNGISRQHTTRATVTSAGCNTKTQQQQQCAATRTSMVSPVGSEDYTGSHGPLELIATPDSSGEWDSFTVMAIHTLGAGAAAREGVAVSSPSSADSSLVHDDTETATVISGADIAAPVRTKDAAPVAVTRTDAAAAATSGSSRSWSRAGDRGPASLLSLTSANRRAPLGTAWV